MRLYFAVGEPLPKVQDTVLLGGSLSGAQYAVTIHRIIGEPRQDDSRIVLEVVATKRMIAGEAEGGNGEGNG